MEIVNKYKYTKAYFKILDLVVSNPKETVFVIRGGQGASKTVSIVELVIQSLLSSEKEASILSSELSKMKRTVIRDYKKICKDWGVLQNDSDFNKSESKHEYENGSYIDFLGADVNDIGKGFRRDILYINEADKMDIDTAVQFISRAKLTIIDYNPDRLFWGDEYVNDNNFLTLTFEDNEYLDESEVNSILDYKTKGFHNPKLDFEQLFAETNIKNKYWANKWKVYGLGLVGSLNGLVFENWQKIGAIPMEAELLGYGLDFGFENDPTALIAVYQAGNNIYLEELIYGTKIYNDILAGKMSHLQISRHKPIIADSASPMIISDLNRLGWSNVRPVGRKDTLGSIDLLQRKNIFILHTSINLIKEFSTYTWLTDKSGTQINAPIDKDNHGIDAVRYVALTLFGRNQGNYSFA